MEVECPKCRKKWVVFGWGIRALCEHCKQYFEISEKETDHNGSTGENRKREV